jgi:phosphoglycolate phosphatase
MNPPDIHAVLFDFDGTLAPNLDLPDMRRQVIALTRQANVPDDVFADCYIVEIIDAAQHWLTGHNSSEANRYFQAAHKLITDFEIQAAQYTQPFAGIDTKLQTLRETGYHLGVVTRNCRAAVLQVFPDLLDHVDALHARDDTTHLKPDPRHLLTCLDVLGCEPARTAMVGDGALDMKAGRELDMYCVGVLTGSADTATLHQAGAHEVIDHCLDLRFDLDL